MPQILGGTVGPQTNTGDGSTPPAGLRQGRAGETVVTELHGKYYEQSYRGRVFWATMTAGVIFPAPAATAANVMTLANPASSGVNLSLIAFDMVTTVIPGTPLTGLYGLYVNNNPVAAAVTGTALAAIAMPLGSGAVPSAKPLTTSTVPVAPTLLKPFAQKVTGEVATVFPNPYLPDVHIDIDGTIVVGQGCAITPQQTVPDTTNATVICSFVWEEIPV